MTAAENSEDVRPELTKIPAKPENLSKHPLDPLTPQEVSAISLAIRKYIVEHKDIKAIKFITCSTANPPKRDVLAYLGIPLVTGEKSEISTKRIIRRGDIDFIDVVTGNAYNSILSLRDNEWVVDKLSQLPEGVQPQISVHELASAEETVRKDPQVQKLAAELGLKPENIYADGWTIGWDPRFPRNRRLQQALLFARFNEHDNLYAHPLDFIPVLDSNTLEVIHIDFPSHRLSKAGEDSTFDSVPSLSAPNGSTAPPSLSEDPMVASGRSRLPFPDAPQEYLPDLLQSQPDFKPSTRIPLKPLHILQPEGVSFKMNGHQLEWQKWKMHVAFQHREGITLSTITYDDDGVLRPLIYRLSLAEMVVPYAAPEHPHPRKFAFDVGEYGVGALANDLSLGCDCLGKVHYLPGSYIDRDGNTISIKHAICIHEEDNGLLWKHTDYRQGGRGHTVRSRRLVISMICTLANYEYLFYYYFYQDGSIEFEVKLSGILSVYMLAPSEPGGPFATQVASRISAQYHQHLFCIRIDPMIDGLRNTMIESDIMPLPDAPTGSLGNWAGNAFTMQDRIIGMAKEGGRDYDFTKDRRWTIVNTLRKHHASGKYPGYVLGYRGFAQTLLSAPNSWVMRRAGFATKSLWVVKEEENEGRMWPAGRYVPQTFDAPEDSVEKWAKGEESLENEDIILFVTLGVNHIPRPEDWPVMPVDHVRLTLKPMHFFKANPSLDVPGANDCASTMAFKTDGSTNHDGSHTLSSNVSRS